VCVTRGSFFLLKPVPPKRRIGFTVDEDDNGGGTAFVECRGLFAHDPHGLPPNSHMANTKSDPQHIQQSWRLYLAHQLMT